MPGMITLGADTLAAHPARIGINAGERLSDFALIVLALDSNRGEIKIVPGLMLAASSRPVDGTASTRRQVTGTERD